MRIYLLLLMAPFLLFACSQKSSHDFKNDSEDVPPLAQEKVQVSDRSCSYFYFLQGNQAELHNQYDQALAAYEQALVCDPQSTLITARIPIILLKQGNIAAAIDRLGVTLQLMPDDRDLTVLLAQLYAQNNEVEDATTLYIALLQHEPKNLDILLRLGLLYQERELYAQAETTFNSAIAVDANSYYAHLYLAQTLALNSKPKKATVAYMIALQKNWSVALAYEIGEFYTNNDFYSDALKIYNGILDYDQGEQNAVILKVQALIQLNRVNDAFAELQNRRAYSNNPEYIDLTTSSILIDQGMKNESITLLQEMVKRYSSIKAAQALALIYYEEGDYDEALKWLDTIPSTRDFSEQGLLVRVQIYIHQNMLSEARELLSDRINENDNFPILHNVLASLYIKSKQNDQAEQTYLNGLKKFPDNIDISYEFALFLEQNKRTTEAIAVMENLLQNDPNNPEALNFLGYTWADNNINLEKALHYTQKAASLMPENGFILDSVGWCFYRLGQFEEAIQHLEKALEFAPNDPNIYEHLGDAYDKNDQPGKARVAYKAAFKLYDNIDKKLSIQQKLDSLE